MLYNFMRRAGAIDTWRCPGRVATALCVGLVILSGCTQNDAAAVQSTPGRLALRPQFHNATSTFTGAPINRARITMVGVDVFGSLTQTIIAGPTVSDLDPASNTWHLDFDYAQPDNFLSVAVRLELINFDGGVETTQWSGFSAPIRVGTIESTPPIPVEVFRGSLRDLDVRAIHITSVPQRFDEGDSARLTVSSEGVDKPDVFWSTSDSAVVSVAANGVIRARRDGHAYIKAFAGTARDSVLFIPSALPASIRIAGSGFNDVAAGESVTAHAVVSDARGGVLNEQVVWESTNPAVMTSSGAGIFKGVAPGEASIRASVAGRSSVAATQTVAVTTRPAANLRISYISLTPADSVLVGSSIRITVIGASNGSADAPAAHARFLILDALTGSVAFDSTFAQPAISAGNPIIINAPFTLASSRSWPSTAVLQIITDSFNEVAETNESDNALKSAAFRIIGH